VDKVIKSYRDLIVWQKSMTMVTAVYEQTRKFPADEMYGLTAQIRRASVSIPSNIAEGYSRNSSADYVRYLRIACGSLYEVRTQLEIATHLGYMKQSAFQSLEVGLNEIEKMLSSMIRRISHPSKS
jgi:four helix bundle protein